MEFLANKPLNLDYLKSHSLPEQIADLHAFLETYKRSALPAASKLDNEHCVMGDYSTKLEFITEAINGFSNNIDNLERRLRDHPELR